ncbi:MAG: hypothetical protein DRR19_09305 [Candidatus Parabeggiatoa sp. nov. 1]|nr:MAG: hypothetical protein DRR19_09305 [Gammaproteobacteria bacterium]
MEEKMANQEDFTTIFIEEAHEHLPTIESSLLKLEKNPQDREQLDLLFRSVHTIKGGAGFVGLNKVGSLAHSMENLLGQVRASEIVLERDHIDALLAGYDRLAQMLDDPSDSEEIDITEEYQRLESLRSLPPSTIQPVDKAAEQAETSSAPTAPSAPQVTDNTTAQNVVKKIAADSDTSYLYEVHLFLNNDLPKIDKSLSQYIEALETDGTIVDSYLDVENRVSLEDRVKGELSFVFLFATDMALDSVTAVLGVPQSQIASSSIDIFKPKYEEKPETRLVNPDEPSQVITEPLDTVPIGEPEIPPNPPLPKGGTPPFRKGGQGEFLPSVSENPAFPKQSQHPSTETEDSIRVHVKRLNKLVDLAGELVLARNQIFRVSETFSSQLTGLKGILHNLNRITTEIQEEIMNTRMQPVGIIFSKFPRLIRQLAADLGKNIELVTEGNDVELDKTIIESLSDPMTHIIRNIADHGIEPPEERQQKGKLPTGLLLQKAFHKSGQVIIQVSDDGRGIDPDGIARKAVEKGFITQEAMLKMTHKEKINLIFTPGLSTAKNVSSVSGRGVGMDVVKSNVEQIGGTIDVTSFVDKGTTLTMTLPLTMAIISGLIVQTRNCWFAFPQVNMEEMVMLHAEEHATKIGQIQGQTVLRLRGKLLPLMSLEKGLNFPSDSSGPDEIPEKNNTHDTMHILIVKSETHRVAIIVDKILGNEEIVVKPIPEYLKHIKSFSGTTILGDGAIAMIIDIPGFMEKNQLSSVEEQLKQEELVREVAQNYETESLLIFDNGTEERFALTIPLIRRVDTLEMKKIQHVGDDEYLDYRGEQMRLLRLEKYMSIQKPDNYGETAHIIIPKNVKVPVGLLINRVIDTKSVVVNLEKGPIEGNGILGSILLDGKITLLLDIYAILETGEPESIMMRMPVDAQKAQSSRLLLVEDTPFFLKVIKDYLIWGGYQVTTAVNGKEALEKMEKQVFDLVLTDIEMPVMDGKTLLKYIRANQKWHDLPVIALTALNDEKTIANGKKAGFSEWLVKLDKEQLLQTLETYL